MYHSRLPDQLQALPTQRSCSSEVFLKKRQEPQVVKSHTSAPYVSRLPGYCHALFHQCLRSLVVPPEHSQESQATKRTGKAPLVSQLAEQRQTFLKVHRCP